MSEQLDGPASVMFPSFLTGGGEMAQRIAAYDWSSSPLGPIESWPQSLRSAINISIGTSFPIAIYWEAIFAFSITMNGVRFPARSTLGYSGSQPARLGPRYGIFWNRFFQDVMHEGKAIRYHDQLLPMHRHGYTEECYFDYTLSPIRGDSGEIEGVF